MAVSRWERAIQKAPANIYIQLGNLAGDPLCWYFWGCAGLSTADVLRVLPAASRRLHEDRFPNLRVVHAGGQKNSMSPLILDGYIIAIDTLDVRRDQLVGQIVVASNPARGLIARNRFPPARERGS